MIRVEFMGPIGKPPAEYDVKTLLELKEVFSEDKELTQWLEICAVAVNDEMVSSLDVALQDGDVVTILPPVCGG